MNLNTILELANTVGTNAKVDVLKKYSDDTNFCKLLFYTLNPLLTYNLSEKTLHDFDKNIIKDVDDISFADIFECCEYLSRLRKLDDATIREVKLFLYKYCNDDEREVYIKILSKTLRLGVTAKTVNKVIPNLIPVWEVQQAFPIDKYPIKDDQEFWLTEKLNGVRATFYDGKLIARSGVPFSGLDHIIKEISWVNVAGFVLDGELTLKNKGELSDNEAFRVTTGILNSKNVNKTGIWFRIFDVIPIKDFECNNPTTKYSTRRIIMDELDRVLKNPTDSPPAKYNLVLPVLYHGTDTKQIYSLLEKMVIEDKEGLMVNLDTPYRRTRHNGILKVKRFYTMDLPIIRCEEGSGRLQNKLGCFVVDYKGNEVKVGSGFSDEQRKEFWERRDELVNTICEVKYKEISSDKHTGLESLQFPVFVTIREDKSEVSYG